MATFEYKAVAANGAISQGRLEAGGRSDAMQTLEGRGLTPLRLAEIGGSAPASVSRGNGSGSVSKLPASNGRFSFQSKKVPFSALEDFTRSLSSLLTAGVPLSRALTILYKESSNPAAGAKWRELHDAVIDGAPLAVAMSKSPEVFPRIYTAMVEAGEAGGFLDVVLAQIADFQAREKELRAKVTAAMLYPAVLLTLAIGVVIFLLVFFIPRFQTLFEGFNAALPLLTRVIVATSDVVRHYGLYLAAIIGAAVVVRTRADRQRPHAPHLGKRPAALAGRRPADGADRHGALLPDAGHVARRGRDAGQRPQRRPAFAGLPDVDRPRRRFHRAREKGRDALRQPRREPGHLRRLDAGNDQRRRGKRPAGPGTRPARGRDRDHARPPVEDGRVAGRTHHAFRHRRLYRRHFHRHGPADFLHSGLHQMKPDMNSAIHIVHHRHRHRSARRGGFTLVEMLLVLVILATLAAIVIPKMAGRSQQAKVTAAASQISSFETVLDQFEVDNGYYPKSGNLNDLLEQPANAPNWKGPYLSKGVPPDPWGNAYTYEYPGKHHANGYDLASAGPDGRMGTDDDINNWENKKQ